MDKSEILHTSNSVKDMASMEPSERHKFDILIGDFASHRQNLQYGQFCQNARHNQPLPCPSFVVPPMYGEGYFPQHPDGPAANVNLFGQPVNTCLVPISPLQEDSSGIIGVYPTHAGQIPRYRGGTATFLPNSQYFKARNKGGNCNSERKEYHVVREGNWKSNTNSQFVRHSKSLSQMQKPKGRMDRSRANIYRYGNPWKSKQDFFNSTNRGPAKLAYGIYKEPAIQGDSDFSSPDQPSSPPQIQRKFDG